MKRPAWRPSLSVLLVSGGFGLFAFGNAWAPLALELLPDTATGYWLELVVPFLPMLFIGCGALLFAGGRR